MISVKAFSDNWIHLYEYEPRRVVAVDPGACACVLESLEAHQLTLTTVLVTHHHSDHVGGVLALKKNTGCEVIGSDPSRVKGVDVVVKDGDRVAIGGIEFEVMATPGHTLTSVCYYGAGMQDTGVVFTGDTLFLGGCGRLFEGSGEQMYHSLSRLGQLPDKTLVCCGHDYTVENLEFARTIEPDNDQIVTQLNRARQEPMSDSTMGQEKQTNVFLRSRSVQEFVQRRKLKDIF